MLDVCFFVAFEGRGFDPVRMARLSFCIDHFIISAPFRIHFRREVGHEQDAAALALAERAEKWFGFAGEEKIGNQQADGMRAQADLLKLWWHAGMVWCALGDEIDPTVADHGFVGNQVGFVAGDHMNVERCSAASGRLYAEIKQIADTFCLLCIEKHGGGNIENQIDHGADFLSVEFHRVRPRAGIGLPVNVAGIITGDVEPVILEIQRGARASPCEFT